MPSSRDWGARRELRLVSCHPPPPPCLASGTALGARILPGLPLPEPPPPGPAGGPRAFDVGRAGGQAWDKAGLGARPLQASRTQDAGQRVSVWGSRQAQVGGAWDVGTVGAEPKRPRPLGPQAFLLMLMAQWGASVVSSVQWGEGALSFQAV